MYQPVWAPTAARRPAGRGGRAHDAIACPCSGAAAAAVATPAARGAAFAGVAAFARRFAAVARSAASATPSTAGAASAASARHAAPSIAIGAAAVGSSGGGSHTQKTFSVQRPAGVMYQI